MPTAPPKTKPSTPRLSEVALVRAPAGVVSTGWPAVRDKCDELGIRFRWWQHAVGQLILAKRADGKYATTVGGTGLSIPRQVGKTFLVGAIVFALCLLRPKLTVVWTAHRSRTAEETFGKMQAFAQRKRIAPFVLKVVLGSGEESIHFTNGSRILFGARERGFGRGFDEVDVVVFDEAQILTENALDDIIPATNQSRQDTGALLLFMGTPPKPKDPGEVFTRMRTEALAGEDDDTCWVEFSAAKEYKPPVAPAPLGSHDWEQVARANPSYPDDTPREAILRMRKNLGADSFLREGLGIWDDKQTAQVNVFGGRKWDLCSTDDLPETPTAIGVAVSVDRSVASIAAAAVTEVLVDVEDPDAEPVERVIVAAVDRRDGVGWLVTRVKELQDRYDCPVVIDGKGPTKDLLVDLEDADVAVEVRTLDEYAEACSRLFDKVQSGTILHSGDELDAAVAGAVWRTVGDRQVWGRRKSVADVSMLEAATLAAHAAETAGAFNIY